MQKQKSLQQHKKKLPTKKVVDTHQGSQVSLHSLCLCMLSELALGEVDETSIQHLLQALMHISASLELSMG